MSQKHIMVIERECYSFRKDTRSKANAMINNTNAPFSEPVIAKIIPPIPIRIEIQNNFIFYLNHSLFKYLMSKKVR